MTSETAAQAAMLAQIRLSYRSPAGRFVLEHGRWFQAAPRPKGLRKMADKACYLNAGRHVLKYPDHLYVEGFAESRPGWLCQHAWAADGDTVIDRTWTDPEHSLYFGVAISVQTFADLVVDAPTWSLFHDGNLPPVLTESLLIPAAGLEVPT